MFPPEEWRERPWNSLRVDIIAQSAACPVGQYNTVTRWNSYKKKLFGVSRVKILKV